MNPRRAGGSGSAALLVLAVALGALTPRRAFADPPPCAVPSPLERATLFHPPKGMTMACGVVDFLDQDTPEAASRLGPMAVEPFNALTISEDNKRLVRIAMTLLGSDQQAEHRLASEEWGLVVNDCGRIHGLTTTELADSPPFSRKLRVGTMSCAMCHSGRVAGRFWEGLGNKRIDVFTMGNDTNRLQKQIVRLRTLNPVRGRTAREIDDGAVRFTGLLANRTVANRTVGLVPDAHITHWIYEVTGGGESPTPPRGEMKVPPLWNLAWRRGACGETTCEVGLFADAFGTGRGWIGGAVLGAGQDRAVVGGREYQALVAKAEEVVLRDVQGPPPYPCPIDAGLARRGKALFTEKGCARCHETAPGKPPRVVRHAKVRTDPDRLLLLGQPGDDGSYGAETRARMDDIARTIPRLSRARFEELDVDGDTVHGYVAPRLEGVWARFPYLHNGSVPTLDDLLSPPEKRPPQFDLTLVETRECFDPVRVGLRDSEACRPNLSRWVAPADAETFETRPAFRNVYDTRRSGHSNVGHDFWRDEATGAWTLDDEQRRALIEYLKTLGRTKLDPQWCPG